MLENVFVIAAVAIFIVAVYVLIEKMPTASSSTTKPATPASGIMRIEWRSPDGYDGDWFYLIMPDGREHRYLMSCISPAVNDLTKSQLVELYYLLIEEASSERGPIGALRCAERLKRDVLSTEYKGYGYKALMSENDFTKEKVAS